MNISLNYGSGVLALPASVVSKLELADSIDLKTLLLLSSDPTLRCENDPAAAVSAIIGCRRDKVDAALKYWSEAGIITLAGEAAAAETTLYKATPEASSDISTVKAEKITADNGEIPVHDDNNAVKPPEAPIQTADAAKNGEASAEDVKINAPLRTIPVYSGEEMERLLDENNGGRRHLLAMCQEITGRVYNAVEANKVIALSDFLGLSNEHILMLFTYCKKHDKTAVPYIEKMAYNLYDEGVDTYDKLDAYFRRKELYEKTEGKLRSMFGLGERALSSKEKKFVKRWIYEFGFSLEMLQRAYEITVDNIKNGAFSFAYMNSVLENWFTNGISTPEQVDAASEERRRQKQQTEGSFNTDEFVALALKKSGQIV